MGFNRTYLPSVLELRKRLQEDKKSTLRWLRKSDAFIGTDNSIKFVKELLTKPQKC